MHSKTKTKYIKLANISVVYSITKIKKIDRLNDTQKHLLWKQFVAWNCNCYSAGPVSDYINNSIFQELLLKKIFCRQFRQQNQY